MKKRRTVDNENRDSRLSPGVSFAREGGGFIAAFDTWFPLVIAAVYALIMGVVAFRFHPIGGFGVETDFYAELVPQVKKLFSGQYSPLNYSAKGPVYSFLLGFVYLFVRDYYQAGLALNIVSGAVFLVAAYQVIRRVFGAATAQLTLFAIMFSYMFQTYTYQAASDVPFLALCALSLFFLFRSDHRRDIVLSAVFGLVAFLTRYNGAFIPMGAAIYLMTGEETVLRNRFKRLALWFGVFIIVGLPWFIPNWIASGSPVRNDNYVNVMLEYYASDNKSVSYENWTDAMPKEFTGMGDIILHDPVYFAKHTFRNLWKHLLSDIKELTGYRLGAFLLAGMCLMWFAGIDRRKLTFLAFGALYYGILSIVFYNPRFSLFLLMFYLPVAFWPFVAGRFAGIQPKAFRFAPIVIAFLIATVAFTTVRSIAHDLKNQPPVLADLKDLGLKLASFEPDKTKIIIARKPHIAYFSGLDYRMFPNNIKTVPEIVTYCRDNGIEYILYSGIEAYYRPEMKILFTLDSEQPGLERLFYNSFGIVYKVVHNE